MTDDDAAEKSGLSATWPESEQMICIFHVLQSLWRWLWNSSNGVKKEDRPILMREFQAVLYCRVPETALEKLTEASSSPTAKKYPKYIRCVFVDLCPLWSG